MIQQLSAYQTPDGWNRGAPLLVDAAWFCLGSPLLSCRFLPGSSWRVWLLRIFGARIGRSCRLKPGLRIKFPWHLWVGDHCWLGEGCWIDNLGDVKIGDSVCISQDVYLCTGNHNYRSPDFHLIVSPITIGSDVWIAARAVLAPGTHIAYGAIIGLAAVVKGDVPANSIMSGNPAAVVGYR